MPQQPGGGEAREVINGNAWSACGERCSLVGVDRKERGAYQCIWYVKEQATVAEKGISQALRARSSLLTQGGKSPSIPGMSFLRKLC